MRVKYIPVFTENITAQIDFFTGKLGFKLSDKNITYQGAECRIIETGSQDVAIVLVSKSLNPDTQNCIILNTDDCLNDYHLLKTGGVIFSKEPQYLPIGLVADFTDPCGNRVLLLEERNYNE